MSLIHASQTILNQVKQLVEQLSDEEYRQMLDVFSGATVGQHMRHIIEFYECVLNCGIVEVVNYDLRQRNLTLEVSTSAAGLAIDNLLLKLEDGFADRKIIVEGVLGGALNKVESTTMRELLYAIEHAVHHMAILKIGIITTFTHVKLAPHFGVAESTIRYKEGIEK